MLKLWLTLYKTKAKHSRQYRTNKFRLKNSNPKPKHNHLKRLRAPRRPKFKLARYFVYVPPLFSQLCVVLLGVSSLARDLASVFALIIGPLVYMSIECFAKCCHFMCHPFTVVAPLAYCCYRVFTLQKAWSCVRPEEEFGRVFDLRKSLVVCSTWDQTLPQVEHTEEFGRVFHLRNSLVVRSTWEGVLSCIRPVFVV